MPDVAGETVNWPVYLWWRAESRVPGLLAVERKFWRLAHMARHPRAAWAGWLHWLARPGIGDQVRDCSSEIRTVARINGHPDALVLDNGHACSWMNCCDPVTDGRIRAARIWRRIRITWKGRRP